MEERTQSLKRKREDEYPRVTFTSGARTFDRLLKESTLDDLKEGIRKKLGYASDVPLQLTQLRDGKSVDLEDDDDFEAFCAAASSLSVVTVQVSAPANSPQFVPAKTTPLPPTRASSAESPKKRGRKKKKSVADEDKSEEIVEASEKPGQKRKAPVADSEDKASEAHQCDAPPPKKKQKNNAAKEVSLAKATTSGGGTEKPSAPAARSTAEGEKATDGTTKEPKRKKAKKAVTVVGDDADPAHAITEPEQGQQANANDREAAKVKERGKKKEKSMEDKAEKVNGAHTAKEKDKPTQTAKNRQKPAVQPEKLETLIDKYQKQKEKEVGGGKKKPPVEEKEVNGAASSASVQATSQEGSDSSSDSDSADETPSPTHKAVASVKPTATKGPVVNGKPKDATDKKKAKEVETLAANSMVPPPAKPAESSSKKSKGAKKAAAALPSQAKMKAIMAQMDELLAANKKKDQDAASGKPATEAVPVSSAAPKKKKGTATEQETEAVPVASAAPKKKGTEKEKGAEALVDSAPPKKSAATDKLPGAPAVSSAANTSLENTGESSPEEAEEAVVSAAPKISKRSKVVICPWCSQQPAHTKSRCNVVRNSVTTNTKLIKQLQAEQAESPTPLREAQIKAVEELIKEKESKPKKEPKKKGGSDEGDIVTGIGASSAMSTVTTTTLTATNEKPSAQANETLTTHSPSADSLVDTPPAEDGSALTAAPKMKASTDLPLPSTSAKLPPVSSIPKTAAKPLHNDSASEISESEEEESLAAHKNTFKPQSQSTVAQPAESASAAVPFKDAQQRPASRGTTQPKPAYQWSDGEAFPSVSQASSSRTVVPPRLSLSHASVKSRSHPLPKGIANKSKEPVHDSSDESSEKDDRSTATQPPSTFLSFDLSNATLADVDLDAVIRGPRVSISTKHLDLSDDDEDEEEDASVDPEGLVEDDEPRLSRRYSKMLNAAAAGSSDEEESDGAESDSSNAGEPAQRPPRLSLSIAPKAEAQENDEDSRQSSPVDHGNLSFGDVNGMASSIEIDAQGDRAFSQALADDTAVFDLTVQNIDESSRDTSGRASPENQPRREEQETETEEEEEEEEEEETATAKPAKDDRHDSIEPFDSPVRTQARRSPIGDADVLPYTPRGLRSRMKGKDGRVPESPAPVRPHSSFEKAMNLLNGAREAEAAKTRSAAKAKAKITAPPTPPADDEQEQEVEQEQEAEKPIKGKRGKSAKPPSQSQKAVKPPSTRSQKALAASQPPASAKPPSRTTRSSKALPATQPAPAVTLRTTRAAARRAASTQPEETPAPPPPAQAPKYDTQESVHKWETLHAESSSQPDETMNMIDELQSVPEEDDDAEEQEQLFIASETQQSFPYSQWQPQMHSTQRKDRRNPKYSSEEEEEDEVENVVMKPTKSTPEMKKKGTTLAFAKLSQIASQPRSFRASLPTAGVAKPVLPDKKRRETMMADLYGVTGDEPSEESGSDSDPGSTDEAEAVPKSHIPRGRRAGLRTGV